MRDTWDTTAGVEGQKRGKFKRPKACVGVVLAVGFRERSVRARGISVSSMEYKKCCCFYRSDKAVLISGERLSQADSLSVAILAVVARLWQRYYRSVTTHCYLKSVLKEEEEKKSLKQSAINLSQPIGVVVCKCKPVYKQPCCRPICYCSFNVELFLKNLGILKLIGYIFSLVKFTFCVMLYILAFW